MLPNQVENPFDRQTELTKDRVNGRVPTGLTWWAVFTAQEYLKSVGTSHDEVVGMGLRAEEDFLQHWEPLASRDRIRDANSPRSPARMTRIDAPVEFARWAAKTDFFARMTDDPSSAPEPLFLNACLLHLAAIAEELDIKRPKGGLAALADFDSVTQVDAAVLYLSSMVHSKRGSLSQAHAEAWEAEAVRMRMEASHRASKAANRRHDKPNGSREKWQRIREIWATGKYSSRDICAEQECAHVDMSLSSARKALRNTPDPDLPAFFGPR